MITNPLTRQVINANPNGCNQYSGKDCYRAGKVSPDIPLMHFGTETAAKKSAVGRPIKKYHVSYQKPARLRDSGRSHNVNPEALAEDLLAGDNEGVRPELVPFIKKLAKEQGQREAELSIIESLKRHGYDSIEYENANEDPGSSSLIPLNWEQIKELDT